MKLSFSIGSKPQSSLKKPSATSGTFADKVEKTDDREYVTEFDSSKLSVDPSKAKGVRVIPPIPNELRPYKKMKNLDLPLQSEGADHQQPIVQFEVDPLSSVEPSSNSMSYGLNLRSNNSTNDKATPPTEKDPSYSVNSGDIRQQMILREDLRKLADENDFDDFDDMPIEGFGRALLAGYGWKEGQGIGRNGKTKEDVKSVEYTRRTGKEGLGFTGEIPVPHSKHGSDNNVKKNSGRQSEKGATGEAQRDENGLFVGMDVRVVGGRDMGLKATVLEVNRGGEFVVLRLLKSEEDVKVRVSDIASLGSVEEERCLRKLKELRVREKNEAPDRRSGKEREREKDLKSSDRESKHKEVKDRRKESGRGREEVKGNHKVAWLTSHIRVRIISKELKGGKLYLKKGEVVDVVGPTTCDVSIDENRELVQGVDQEFLETVLPRRGGHVLVLYGRHKGVYGSLVERDTDKETGVVRDAETHELLNVRLEQVAEYLGDPSYIGY